MTTRIADIAKAANVSPATVARVINNNGYVSDQKREQINKIIDELGYVPNIIASSLRRNKPNFIGHVLSVSSENPFFARICNAVNEMADRAGYQVLTAVTQKDAARERAMIDNLIGLMVDAIIFTGNIASDSATIDWILSRGIPVVMVERPRHVSQIDVVLMDSFQGSSMATEHIISKGHRDIAFIGLKKEIHEVEYQRYHGFSSTMAAHGLPIREEWMRYAPDYKVAYGRRAMEEILACGKIPSALFATSDVVACGALQALYERGLRVPDDFSIVGFDNTLSSTSAPQLTSIEMQLEQIGAAAVELIVERKKGARVGAKTVMLSPMLVDRGSVKQLT